MSTPPEADMYERDLGRNAANHVPLSPLSFLRRAALVYPRRLAVVHGDWRCDYAALERRCRQLAAALAGRGVGPGDTVSVMAPNVPAMLEAHYGVPMTGAVLNALNYRLDAAGIAFILEHARCKVLLVDREFSPVIEAALAKLDRRPLVIDIDDPLAEGGTRLGETDYESFLAEGGDGLAGDGLPDDEWRAISLNYTSGTTGNPKGVVYHHRGAYLNALGQVLAMQLTRHTRYLWTLPMFHCNGWCFTWAVTAAAGTHVCLRKVEPAQVFDMIGRHAVTHMCGAPIVLNMLAHAPATVQRRCEPVVEVATGGAAPPSRVIEAMTGLGFNVTHLYGLTETYGPSTICAEQDEWAGLSPEARATKVARQGVAYPTLEALMVADSQSLRETARDGIGMGELMLRGNTVMKGYLKNPEATAEALRGGWFHSGDLAVRHDDGYVEIRDRAKDIIITGGENVSSLEVEELLYRHPAIMEAAVVARTDPHWGETVCAFVTRRAGVGELAEADVIAWCRERIAHFKAPRTVVFGPLPKTSTGKVQKFVLRERAAAL